MNAQVVLAAVAALAVALGLVSRPLRQLPMTEPLAALLLGVALGPHAVGAVELPPERTAESLATAAEVVLSLSLMSVALRFSLPEIRPQLPALALLVTVVLVVAAAATAGAAALTLGGSLAGAGLLGACLASTDPVLSSNVVDGDPAERQLPERLRLRLSVEAGANGGLAFPLVAVTAALAGAAPLGGEAVGAAVEVVWAVVLGGGLGWAVGRLMTVAERHEDLEHSAFLVLTVALALALLGIANLLGANGLIAVFVGGLAYNHQLQREDRAEEWVVQEAINRYLVLPVFALFGAGLPWPEWRTLGVAGVAFAVAVLLVRRLPAVFALSRPLRATAADAAFLGWFGPVGVAALTYLGRQHANGVLDERLWAAGTLTVALSTVAHGLTAAAGRRAYVQMTGGSR